MTRKEYRKKYRKIVDILTKKFIDVSIETNRLFEDEKEIDYLNLFFYYDDSRLNLDDIKDKLKDMDIVINYKDYINQITLDFIIDDININTRIYFFNSVEKYKFNILINSFNCLKDILNILSNSYSYKITNMGLMKEKELDGTKTNVLVTDDFDLIMETFGFEMKNFNKSFTKEQFFEFVVVCSSFTKNNFINLNTDNIYLKEFSSLITENQYKYPSKLNIVTINKLELLSDPLELAKKLTNRMDEFKKDIYEELMYFYINKYDSVNMKNLDRKILLYINSLLEIFFIKYNNGDEKLIIDNKEISLFNRKIAKSNLSKYLFKIGEEEFVYGFDISVSLNADKIKLNTVLNNNTNSEIVNIANKLTKILLEEFNFSFFIELNNNDIRKCLNESIKDLKVKK